SFKEYLRFTAAEVPENTLALISRRYELIPALEKYMRVGGFPAIVTMSDEDVGNELLAAYYDSIVYRDIIQAHNIRSSALLAKLLTYLITNISSQVSVHNLSKVFSCNAQTIEDYLAFARDAYLIYLVPYFTYSLKTQTRMLSKSYIIDTGLRHAVSSAFSLDTGKCMENIVCIELIRRGYSPAYWSGKNEVDFVIRKKNHELAAINVCCTDNIPDREFAGLREFEAVNPEKNVQKIILSEDTEEVSDDIQIIPLWKWLLEETAI
ncbi:MAG TPA: ATP-binding protein, partial [Methanocorpusculum sp.]|nr:ATP-binding protein [Methanocorpusculum sp.]